MPEEWSNWSGSLRFRPRRIVTPADEGELAALVQEASARGETVRVVGSGHSSTPIVETSGTLVSLAKLQGIVSHDRGAHEATVLAGTILEDLGPALFDVGLGFPNLGDVATQTVAGVIATGTHGTGKSLQCLSNVLVGGRLVTGTGEIVTIDEDAGDLLRAARVSLGALGIFTRMTLRLMPAYTVQRREYCTTVDACLPHLDELVATNRGFDFYWYPRSDEVKLRLVNPPGGGTRDLPYATLVEQQTGWAHEIIPKHSHLPYEFDEMEYAVPFAAGLDCFQEVRRRVMAEHRRIVGWRLLYRTVAADDGYLSPYYHRPAVTISLHQNASLPFWDYFQAIEPVLRAYEGRPHWAKKHTLRAAELRPLYPCWEQFLAVRRRLDPRGVFLNDYLRELLGVEES